MQGRGLRILGVGSEVEGLELWGGRLQVLDERVLVIGKTLHPLRAHLLVPKL